MKRWSWVFWIPLIPLFTGIIALVDAAEARARRKGLKR